MKELLDDAYLQTLTEETISTPAWYSRLFAGLLDIIFFGILLYASLLLLPASHSLDIAVHGMLVFIPTYKILSEGLTGYTLGKLIIGFKVVTDDKELSPITLKQANRRFLLAWPMYLFPLLVLGLDHLQTSLTGVEVISETLLNIEWFLMGFSLISAASYVFHDHQQAWYDRLANTICITYKNV